MRTYILAIAISIAFFAGSAIGEETLTLDEFLADATDLLAENGNTLSDSEKRDLIDLYYFEEYGVSLEILQSAVKSQKILLTSLTKKRFLKNLITQQVNRFSDQLDTIAVLITKERLAVNTLDPGAVATAQRSFAKSLGACRAGVNMIESGLQSYQCQTALIDWYEGANPISQSNNKPEFDELISQLERQGQQLIGQGYDYPVGRSKVFEVSYLTQLNAEISFIDVSVRDFDAWTNQISLIYGQQNKNVGVFLVQVKTLSAIEGAEHLTILLLSAKAFLANIPATLDALYSTVLKAGANILQWSGNSGAILGVSIGGYEIATVEELELLLTNRAVGALAATAATGKLAADALSSRPVDAMMRQKSSGGASNSQGGKFPNPKTRFEKAGKTPAGEPRAGPAETEPTPAEIKTWQRIPLSKRVDWYSSHPDRIAYKNWFEQTYDLPSKYTKWADFWEDVEIHHIRPRAFGGKNNFENLTPILKEEHYPITSWFNRLMRYKAGR